MEEGTMSKKLENAIIISGRCYELVNDTDGDECERCALSDQCNCNNNPLCLNLFGDAYNKRFEEVDNE